MELTEIGRRIHERDTTLDLPGVALDLIAQITSLETRLRGLQADLHACQGEVSDRDQRIEAAQLTITRQGAFIAALRDRLERDIASHVLAQRAVDAFDSGKVIF
jgi:hypothetical protein